MDSSDVGNMAVGIIVEGWKDETIIIGKLTYNIALFNICSLSRITSVILSLIADDSTQSVTIFPSSSLTILLPKFQY